MFLMYSTDITYDRRPWLAWITFPAVVAASFWLLLAGHAPSIALLDIGGLYLFFLLPPLLVFAYLLSGFIILWFFGKAVCSKVGNMPYVALLIAFALAAALINVLCRNAVLWPVGCAISAITGMYLAYWPTHPIDCLFLIPPWTTFSVSGFWGIIGWMLLDALFVAFFGWTPSLIAHPAFLLAGLITALLLIKLRIANLYDDDYTLLQVFSRHDPPDPAWEHSWSARRPKEQAQDAQADLPVAPVPPAAKQNTPDPILCPCGQIVTIPSNAAQTTCPACSRTISRKN
ncbi:MAG TPA: rhomboid family intramembrane serine protease [Anaerohalosphaeraceae bacterium]|jgi:hypothetical protein|nr:rhomboid family intramembrane serine protease [Anaerohalosphaeraceae bacterium]HRT49854.1 rhomboid family intramembrane serine protease [Anaerohalosphaeraceae bacterium]HRT86746.1 rhomboid family intramembrane serine protease [Anaerohalosphaeraceae bacterium]